MDIFPISLCKHKVKIHKTVFSAEIKLHTCNNRSSVKCIQNSLALTFKNLVCSTGVRVLSNQVFHIPEICTVMAQKHNIVSRM